MKYGNAGNIVAEWEKRPVLSASALTVTEFASLMACRLASANRETVLVDRRAK